MTVFSSGCGGAAREWRIAPDSVRFSNAEITVELPEGHPLRRLELWSGGKALLLAEVVHPGAPHRVRFEYEWRPGQPLLLRGVRRGGHATTRGITAPPSLPFPVEAELQIPSGVPVTAANGFNRVSGVKGALALPAGARGRLTLALRNLTDAPLSLHVSLRLPAFLERSGAGGAASPHALEKAVTLALRDEIARIEIPFRVLSTPVVTTDSGQGDPATEAARKVTWEVTVMGSGQGAAPKKLKGAVPLRVLSSREMRAGLTLLESIYPADEAGQVLVQHPREKVVIGSAWSGVLSRWLGVSPVHNPYQPRGFFRLIVQNRLAGDVVVLARTRIVAERPGAAAVAEKAFGNPLLDAGRRETVSLRLVPAGGSTTIAEPLYLDERLLRPGAFRRCTELVPWGMEGAGTRTCVPFQVVRSPLAGWVVVWGGTALAVGLMLAGLATMRRWAGRFPLRDLILIALMAGLAFLVVSVPGFAVRSLTVLFLGPFNFVLEGLIFKFLLFLLLGCLFALVRRTGVFFLFYGLWMVAQALLNGHHSPMILLFAGATITFIEAGLWLGGLTGGNAAGRPVPWLRGALLVGLAEGISVFWGMQLIKLLFRVYLADWFVLLQATTEALYAGLGLAVGLRMGIGLAAARRPDMAGAMARGMARGMVGDTAGGAGAGRGRERGRGGAIHGGALLAVENLTYSYPGAAEPVLRNLSFHLDAGEVVLLEGRSGSGKTTLLRLIQGLLPWPGQAGLTLAGRSAGSYSPRQWAANCGLLFQEAALQVVRPTVEGEVAFGLEVTGAPEGNAEKIVSAALREFGLEGLRKRNTATLSGGELQRTALAGLRAMGPRVLMLDEPLAHLDEAGRRELVAHLRRLAAQGYAVLVAEHRTGPLLDVVRRVVRLDGEEPAPETSISKYTVGPRAAKPAAAPTVSADNGSAPNPSTPTRSPKNRAGPARPLVRFEGVGLAFPDAPGPLFAGLRAELAEGRAIALTGPNGAGKSTLFSLLLGLRKPQTGSVLVGRRQAHRLSWRAKARLFGYLPQQADLVLHAPTAGEELARSLRWAGQGEAERKAEAWLERLQLRDAAQRPPHLLSRGERQRLALGAVMIAGPRLLVLDEPFAGQHPQGLAALLDLLRGFLAEDPARAVIVATHDLELLDLAGQGGFFDERWRLHQARLTVWAGENDWNSPAGGEQTPSEGSQGAVGPATGGPGKKPSAAAGGGS